MLTQEQKQEIDAEPPDPLLEKSSVSPLVGEDHEGRRERDEASYGSETPSTWSRVREGLERHLRLRVWWSTEQRKREKEKESNRAGLGEI